MASLPEQVEYETYMRDLYGQPLGFWQDALATISLRHRLGVDTWTRASLGRNVVFLAASVVVKLGPPCWRGDIAREVLALRAVPSTFPAAVPTVVAAGMVDGWEYLVEQRLPGTNLLEVWDDLHCDIRADLAFQHGKLMTAVHATPITHVAAELRFDWAGMIAEQRATCVDEMQAAGVDRHLVSQIGTYLDGAFRRLDAEEEYVFLHGDLTHLNLLVEQRDEGYEITGLMDWGDIKIGPRMHDFISPGVHMYRGDRAAMERWYFGYGWNHDGRTSEREHEVMARAMLYYADHFSTYIRAVPGAADCRDWATMAQRFWHFTG